MGLTISKTRLGVVEPRVASNYIRIYTHIVYYFIRIYLFCNIESVSLFSLFQIACVMNKNSFICIYPFVLLFVSEQLFPAVFL